MLKKELVPGYNVGDCIKDFMIGYLEGTVLTLATYAVIGIVGCGIAKLIKR